MSPDGICCLLVQYVVFFTVSLSHVVQGITLLFQLSFCYLLKEYLFGRIIVDVVQV